MKKIVWLVALAAMVFAAGSAEAYDAQLQKWTIGFNGSYVSPSESDADDTGYFGGSLAYDLSDYVAIGIESGYMKWSQDANGQDYGDITSIPLLGTLVIKNPMPFQDTTVVPYGIFGLGVIFYDFDESSALSNNNISVEDDSGLGIKAGVGLDYYLTENAAINLEISYLWADRNFSVPTRGTVTAADFDADAWLFGGGLKFRY